MTAANAAVGETNFGTCRFAATVCYLVRAAHELGTRPGNFGSAKPSKFVTAPRFAARKTPGKVAAPGANIESRPATLRRFSQYLLPAFFLGLLLCQPGRNRRPLTRIVEGMYNDAEHSDTLSVLI